jgi:Leucine-rich repeat (LRR) protein
VISEADEDQSLHGDIEQGIVPSSFEEPTIEAHVVDEALEQERYDQLYGDLENMRKALSTANKQPIIMPATRLMSCKERSLSMLYGGRLLFLIGGCIVLVVVISSMIKNVKAPPDLLPDLLSYLESISPDGGAALSDLNSPQFRAATWLAGNQNLFLMEKRSLIQRYALATLYYSTGGDQWFTNNKWLTDSNECEWYNTKWSEGWESDSSGIRTFCSNEDEGDLEMIFLQGNNLHGQVPLELSLLSNSLVRVDLREGYLSGTFPEALLRLSSLEWLELTLNPLLTGPLPTKLGQLPALKFLAVGRLGGEKGGLPSELGLLTGLETLGLEGNDHTGKIPSELSLLTALKELHLERNSFTGTVPSLRLPYLEKLYLNENLLTGTIPTELGLLRALEVVALQNNSLTSTIPEALGLLTNLKDLYLDSNKLTSTIPSAVVSLSHLEHLFLHKQMLNGTIPTEFGLATSLTEVALFDNMLSGTVPTELSGLPLLEKLKLHKNSLTGAIELDGDTCPPPPLVVLTADCNEVACCCTQCCNILFVEECI